MDDLLTVPQVAKKLAISEETVRRYLRKGIIPGVPLEGYWRVKPEALESFIQSRSTGDIQLEQEPTP